MPIRIASVGLGLQGQAHLPIISSLDDYELVAVCDVSPDTKGPEGVQRFEDPAKLFAAGIADAVVISVPPWHNARVVGEALDAGLHVYCEKPLAPTIGQARALDRTDRVVQVGFQYRFQPAIVRARELLSEIGDLHRADIFATGWWRTQHYYDDAPWRSRWDGGSGGVLQIQAVHNVDTFLWICGMPSRVTAHAYSRHNIQVEDDVTALLEFPNGATGVLVASTFDPVGDNVMRFHGDLGSLEVRMNAITHTKLAASSKQTIATAKNVYMALERETVEVPLEPGGGIVEMMTLCHRDFIAAINESRPARNSIAEASKSLELANAIYLSAIEKRPVDLPLDADAYEETYAWLCRGRLTL